MESIVNHSPSIPKNLHPIWYRHFGFQPQATRDSRYPWPDHAPDSNH